MQGYQGAAGLLRRPQAGLVHQGTLQAGTAKGGHELPEPLQRASLQRASVPEAHLLPLPDQDDEGAQPDAEQLQHAVPGAYHPEGAGQGNRREVYGGRRTVRAHHERQRLCQAAPALHRRDCRHGEVRRADRALLLAYARRECDLAGHRPLGKGNAHRRQPPVPAHPLRRGGHARKGGYRHPLRETLHGQKRLPPLLCFPGGAAALLQPHLQPVCANRQQRGKLAEVREVRKEHAVALPLFEEQQHQPRVDGPVPERSPFLRADLGAGALQRHGVERRRGGTEAYQERRGQPAGKHGVRAAPQHHRLPNALLGGDARQRGGLSCRGKFPYVHRTGGMPLYGGNQLPQLALALRHQDGGQAHGKAPAPRHQRPADEARHHHQPQQVRAGTERLGQVVLHEPPREAVLGTGRARGAGGHGKLLSGLVRNDPAQDKRGGRRVFHLYGGETDFVQPVLHRRLRVRRGEEGQHQDIAADALEVGGRQGDEDRERRAGQRGERLHRTHQG